MKTILSAIMSILLAFSCLPCAAEETGGVKKVYMYEDYGDELTGVRGDWRINSATQGAYAEKDTLDGEGVLHVHTDDTKDRISIGLKFANIFNDKPERIVLSLRLRCDDYCHFFNSTADAGPNPNWHFFSYFSTDADGFLNIGGKPVRYLKPQRFYTLAFLTDFINKKVGLYIDGEYAADFRFDPLYNYLAENSLVLESTFGKADVYVDDFAIYEADSVCTYDEVRTKFAEQRERYTTCPTASEIAEYAKGFSVFANEARFGSINGKRLEMPKRLYTEIETVMAPVRCTAEAMGAEVEYTPDMTYIRKGCLTATVKPGSDIAVCGDKKIPLGGDVIIKDGSMYAPAEGFFSLFGNVYHNGEYDFYAIGDSFENRLDSYVDAREMYYYLVYEKPTPETFARDYKMSGVHPRVYYTPESIERIKTLAATDPDMKIWYDKQIAQAEAAMGLPLMKMTVYNSGVDTSFDPSPSVYSQLAFAYMVTHDRKYGDELWRQLQGFFALPDLNHMISFLNGSGAASCVAMAYDWAYDYFTPEQREKIEHTVRNLALDNWMRAHQRVALYGSAGYAHKATDNINCVMQAQLSVCAAALYDSDPEYYSRFFAATYRQIEYYLPNYAPDGGYYEGPLYWEYATSNLVKLFDVTESCFGTLYGYYDVFNIDKTGSFPLYMNGAMYAFNFADGSKTSLYPSMSLSYYFAKKNNDPEFASIILNIMRSSGTDVGSRWYDPAFKSDEVSDFPLDSYFRVVEAGSMRERWNDTGACYLGYRGGANTGGHNQLDKGTFVFDAMGERWAEDLGRDNYSYPGYFDRQSRYLYYMNRGEGHNVLLVNPKGRYADQTLDAKAVRTAYESKKGGGYAVLDTTKMYDEADVSSAQRGFMLTDYRKTAVIRDELQIKKNGCDIWWFMHTGAEIEILEGGRRALLTQKGKRVMVSLDCTDPNAVFTVMDPVAFDESPHPKPEYITEIKNIKKLAVNAAANVGEFDLTVNMKAVELDPETEFAALTHNLPIKDWTVDDKVKKTDGISNIYVNGEAIAAFTVTNTEYNIDVERESNLPIVTADANVGWVCDVQNVTQIPSTAVIKISREDDPNDFYVVRVNFSIPLYTGLPDDMTELEIKGFEASPQRAGQADGEAKNVFDGDFTTRWASDGNSTITVDLGEVKDIGAVANAFYLGNERVNFFNIELSDDKKTWKTVFTGESTGKSEDYMTVFCEGSRARYVRINYTGTSTGSWNSLLEIRILEEEKK